MKNIIFLDIDEVLCTWRSRYAYRSLDALDPVGCHILLSLVKETNSQIVIHSSWRRLTDGIPRFREELISKCPELLEYVIGCTDPKIYDRLDSIADWLDKNVESEQVLDYAIIDDLSLNFQEHEELADHFYQIENPEVGIGFKERLAIKKQLNGYVV